MYCKKYKIRIIKIGIPDFSKKRPKKLFLRSHLSSYKKIIVVITKKQMQLHKQV